jgi:aspartate aminotransferase-like enzyme
MNFNKLKKLSIENFVFKRNQQKPLFTPGPSSLSVENIVGLANCFGRGDADYLLIENEVINSLKNMTGHKNLIRMQGSGTLALEICANNFLYGKVLIIDSGFYSYRLLSIASTTKKYTKEIKQIDILNWKDIHQFDCANCYDWIWMCGTETSVGIKLPVYEISKIAKKIKAKLMIDATASIGLEEFHDLADVISYSSCKGLFGLTGASFVAYNINPKVEVESFYMNLYTHLNKKITGPYHSILSLYYVLKDHDKFKNSVVANKQKFLSLFPDAIPIPAEFQPLLCTQVSTKISSVNESAVLYKPRQKIKGSIVCHIGEGYLGKNAKGHINNYLIDR